MSNGYLDKLLEIDMTRMASFLEKDPQPFTVNLTDTKKENEPTAWTTTELHECVAEVIQLSYSHQEEDKAKAFVTSALVWEFFHNCEGVNKDDLASYLSSVFIRLGVPISAKTLTGIDKEFESPHSILDKIELGERLSKHHQVSLQGGGSYYLSDFQKKVWDTSLKDSPRTSISSSTSGGKSFIISLKIIEELLKSFETSEHFYCFYMVPTISLMNQVTHDFSNHILNNSILSEQWKNHNLSLRNNVSHLSDSKDGEKYSICIITPERIEGFSWENWKFADKTIIVFDECHNAFPNISQIATSDEQEEDDEPQVERGGSSQSLNERSEKYRAIIEKSIEKNIRAIFSAPDLEKLPKFLRDIFSLENINSISDNQVPVLKIVYSLDFSDKKKGKSKLTQNVRYKGLHIDSRQKVISINKLGKSNYEKPKDIKLIANIINKSSWPTLVVDRSPKNAQKVTEQLSEIITESLQNDNRNLLREYIKDEIYSEPEHFKLYFDKGLVSHHGKLPKSLRLCLEIGIKEDLFPHVVCTTTLLQGVNFPVKLLICKDDKTGSTEKKKKITLSKNDFSNMMGRSGRLTKDIVGYVLILNKSELEPDKIEDKNTNDEVIDDLFTKEDDYIKEILSKTGSVISNPDLDDNTISVLIFIRQRIFTLTKEQAEVRLQKRLTKLNISFDDIYAVTLSGLANLSNQQDLKELSRLNPTFDPYDLQKIYDERYSIPRIKLKNQDRKIVHIEELALHVLNWMHNNLLWYLKKERIPMNPKQETALFNSLSITLNTWSKGEPYKNMLESYIDYYKNKGEKKDYIDFQKNLDICVYNISKLIKPWIDCDDLRNQTNQNIMTQIEYGGYQPVFFSILQYGLDREVALKLSKIHPTPWDKLSFSDFLKFIKDKEKDLNSWEKKQIEYLFPIKMNETENT